MPELTPNSSTAGTSLPTTSLESALSNVQLLAQNATSVLTESATREIAASPAAEVVLEIKLADLSQLSPAKQVTDKLVEGVTSQPDHYNQAPDAIAQVTSVSQLSDVQPTAWAFQACNL